MSESEWLDLMLEEIVRKRNERTEAREETQRRHPQDSEAADSEAGRASPVQTT